MGLFSFLRVTPSWWVSVMQVLLSQARQNKDLPWQGEAAAGRLAEPSCAPWQPTEGKALKGVQVPKCGASVENTVVPKGRPRTLVEPGGIAGGAATGGGQARCSCQSGRGHARESGQEGGQWHSRRGCSCQSRRGCGRDPSPSKPGQVGLRRGGSPTAAPSSYATAPPHLNGSRVAGSLERPSD